MGHNVGLISEDRYKEYSLKKQQIERLTFLLQTNKLVPTKENNDFLYSIGSSVLKDGITFYNLLKRPEINMDIIKKFIDIPFDDEIIEQVEISIKYEGYIKKAEKEAEKLLNLENKKIPDDINYDLIHNIASEAKQKLKEVKPTSIAQALRISGVNPADISILMVYLKKEYHHE